MIKVNTQITEDIHNKIVKISQKKEWSIMYTIGKLIILAFKENLDKKL